MSNSNQKKEAKVENINDIEQKVQIEYPSNWQYKIVTMDADHTKKAVLDVIDERLHTLTHSNNSKGGKYVSMNLETLVQNEEDRNFIYEALKAHELVKMVL